MGSEHRPLDLISKRRPIDILVPSVTSRLLGKKPTSHKLENGFLLAPLRTATNMVPLKTASDAHCNTCNSFMTGQSSLKAQEAMAFCCHLATCNMNCSLAPPCGHFLRLQTRVMGTLWQVGTIWWAHMGLHVQTHFCPPIVPSTKGTC